MIIDTGKRIADVIMEEQRGLRLPSVPATAIIHVAQGDARQLIWKDTKVLIRLEVRHAA
jgi:hypothetical protein